MTLRKGDRVCFKVKDGFKQGVVLRGGAKKVTAIADSDPEREWSGPSSLFVPSDVPVPKDDPSPMDRYSLKGYKEIEGHGDSATFSAKICLDGKPLMHAGNNGWGGSNEYHPLSMDTGYREALDAFTTAVKAWAKQFGYENMQEPEDWWVQWYQNERPYGVLAANSIRKLRESIDGLESGSSCLDENVEENKKALSKLLG